MSEVWFWGRLWICLWTEDRSKGWGLILLMPSLNLASVDGSGLDAELSGGKEARSNAAVLLGHMAPANFVLSLTASSK
jgi:hypothetical protein